MARPRVGERPVVENEFRLGCPTAVGGAQLVGLNRRLATSGRQRSLVEDDRASRGQRRSLVGARPSLTDPRAGAAAVEMLDSAAGALEGPRRAASHDECGS